MEGLGVRLRDARVKAKLSQAQVAKRLGDVGRTAVTRWEGEEKGDGKNNEPDVETLFRLAEMYKVSVYELVGRDAPTGAAPPGETEEARDWREMAKSLARAQEARISEVEAVYAKAALATASRPAGRPGELPPQESTAG